MQGHKLYGLDEYLTTLPRPLGWGDTPSPFPPPRRLGSQAPSTQIPGYASYPLWRLKQFVLIFNMKKCYAKF